MKREFSLREIGFQGYSALCEQAGIPLPRTPSYRAVKGRQQPRRYFRMLDSATYPDIGRLLASLPDEHQSLGYVWFPEGDISVGEARKLMRETPEDYLSRLSAQEQMYRLFIAELTRGSVFQRLHADDRFLFERDNDAWFLRQFAIQCPNIRFYRFPLNSISGKTPSIHGVYLR